MPIATLSAWTSQRVMGGRQDKRQRFSLSYQIVPLPSTPFLMWSMLYSVNIQPFQRLTLLEERRQAVMTVIWTAFKSTAFLLIVAACA